jgi:hypothetical protein
LFIQAVASAQTAAPPQVVGRLAGPGAPVAQPGLRLYGTDSGWTFEHRGKLVMLFGDTWPTSNLPCEPVPPLNDDAQGLLPLRNPGGIPPLFFETSASSPSDFDPIKIFRDGVSIPMGFGKLPSTGFSDGRNAIAALGTGDSVRCQSPSSTPRCPGQLTCVQTLGECLPVIANIPLICNVGAETGCFQGQTCTATTGFCTDPTSSQNDGTTASLPFTIAQNFDFGVQRPNAPVNYDSAAVLPTNKFTNITSRTVRRFTFIEQANDYRPGDDTVLMWGRPGFSGEQGRQAQLYLMAHKLPLPVDSAGKFRLFKPLYFAGLHKITHQPKWSFQESEAKPIALDGVVDGNPHENRVLVDQEAISYLPAPINKWVMLYSGDVPDVLLVDPVNSRNVTNPGAIMIRFADNPWGPWSVERPYLQPGNPAVVGDPYGPGGFMFHYACVDQPPALCARTDPHRPLDSLNPGCAPPPFAFDIGRLYGANIIDAYTKADGHGGLDVFWNLSTWNPYGVMLMKSNFRP